MMKRTVLAMLVAAAAGDDAWVEPMRKVHAKFTGQGGVVAQIGDSITITMAFFVPLRGEVKNVPAALKPAHAWLRSYVQPRCWEAWKGAEFGNTGMMTSRWGAGGIARWLKKMNPEVALVMFGTNDTYAGPKPPEYTENMRKIARACVANGTIPILYTIPPVGNQAGNAARTRHVESFVEAVRQVAGEEKVPLIDFYGEILARQPTKFAKTLLGDNLHPSYPGPHQRDFSAAALAQSGYTLRNYLTLKALHEVQRKVLAKVASARDPASERIWRGPTCRGRPSILVGLPKRAPSIDGRLNDAAWKVAAPLRLRMLDGDTRKPTHETYVRVCASREAVFVAFRCDDSGKLIARKRPDDGNVWEDDCVEVFLSPRAQATGGYHHLIVNPEGSQRTALGKDAKAWNPRLELAARTFPKARPGEPAGWCVEIKIPFSQLKLPADRKALAGPWRINLNRTRQPRKDTGE